jgi:hypothetical protein
LGFWHFFVLSRRLKMLLSITRVLALTIIIVQYGCSGQVYTIDGSGKSPGVRVYTPVLVIEESVNTAAIDGTGKVVATRDGSVGATCHPTLVQKIATYPDFTKPYYLAYEAGILEKYEFALTLENGVLKSVNTKSEPDRGETLKNLVAAAKDAATLAKATVPGGTPPCTSLPVLKDVYRYPELKPYPG